MIRFLLLPLAFHALLLAQWGGELRVSLRSDPRTLDPALVDESSGETIRYLSGGVLVRLNRVTQLPQPELAESWKVLEGGRRLDLKIRKGLQFSDGTPFTAHDVAFTFSRLMDPKLRSPTADAFRSGAGTVTTEVKGPQSVVIRFPAPVASLDRLLDQVAIQSATSPLKERAVLGPFVVAEYKSGSFILMKRNPHYWKSAEGRRLPRLDSIRLEIISNRDLEVMKLRRGDIHMVEGVDPDTFERLKSDPALITADAGPSTDVEMLWFNQSPKSGLPAHKREWFQSKQFRQAISHAINRQDLVRIAWRSFAQPASGPVPSNSFWFNKKLKAPVFDQAEARRILQQAGFRYAAGKLTDAKGNQVEFSLVTSAGNKTRTRLAALIQQDLSRLGIQLNIVALDFPSLVERISKTLSYEACLLGLVNVDPDPNGQMNIWLSSAVNHPWNPSQTSPATPWEAEIDQLMQLQASSASTTARKKAFDRVQEIAAREVPIIYLANRSALNVFSSAIRNLSPSAFRPNLLWNVEQLGVKGVGSERASASR